MGELDKLPTPALIAFGSVLALIFAVRYLGLFQGQSASPEKSAAAAQVAAVIVDPSALNKATAAVEALNMTLMEMNSIAREGVREHSALNEELDRIREELRIQREVSRARPQG